VALALASFVGNAHAHIDLLTPEPREHGPSRDPNSNIKQGPCGQETNARTERVSVYEPGETIEVAWDETTNHRSYYRVAFDIDGDDAFPMFLGDGVGTEGIDPSGLCPVDGQVILAYDMDDRAGGRHTLQVRLPDVECERCTLQVIQFMYDRGKPYYFQCADLTLRRPPADALDAGPSDAAAPPTAGDAGVRLMQQNPSAAPGCSSRIAPDPPQSSDDDADDERPPAAARPSPNGATAGGGASMPDRATSRSDGGCSLQTHLRAGSNAAWLLLIGAWAISRTRRHRGARRSS